MTGGISNAGLISASSYRIYVNGSVTTFDGGISNGGVISSGLTGIAVVGVETLNGGISNGGVISSGRTGIFVDEGSTFLGGISNSGTISAPNYGIFVSSVANFGSSSAGGGITNSGTISGGLSGIAIENITSFAGGINNSGTISVGGNAIFVTGITTFSGNISNSGTITAATGIKIGSGVSFADGAIINSGTISGSTAAIDVTAATSPVTIVQIGGLISGAINLSTNADVLDVGGGINGNIVGAGSADTINFVLGSGSFTYGSAYGFTGINQVNVVSGSVYLEGTNSATNVTVNGGLLEVGDAANTSATLTSTNAVDVVGGTLAGHGTIAGDVHVGAAGTIMPGGSIGVLTINGDLAMQSTTSTYAVDFTPTEASRTQVNGTATLGGAQVVATLTPIPGYGTYVGRQYTILTSTGDPLTDTFNPDVKLKHAPLTPSQGLTFNGIGNLTYDPNNVFLSLPSYAVTLVLATPTPTSPKPASPTSTSPTSTSPTSTPSTPGGSSLSTTLPTTNAVSVAGDFNQFILAGGHPPAAFNALGSLTGDALNHAVGQLAGQTQGSFAPTGFIVGDMFINLLLNPYIEGRDGFGSVDPDALPAMAYAPVAAPSASAFSALHIAPQATFQPHLGFWAAGYGATGTISGNSTTGASSSTSQIYGIASGADYRLTPDTMVGLAVGGGTTSWQLGQGSGSGHSDMFQTGLYGSTRSGPAYVSAALAYSLQQVSTNRIVSIGGADALRGNFDANILSGRVEAGYRVPYAGFAASPYGAIRTQAMFLPSYGETSSAAGSAVFALNYASHTYTTTRTELGVWLDSDAFMNNGIKLYSRIAYAHDFHDEGTSTAFFQSLPGSSSFIINSVKPARDGALVTAGAEYALGGGWSVLGRFDGEYSRTTDIFSGTGMIKKVW